jgi:CheY-like chemotaxis protein
MEVGKQKNKHKILIVDDDNDLLEMLSDILTNAGFKVVTATDGIDGSFKYSNETFDLVLTDIKMPKKDGIKFVQYIQSNDAQKMMKIGSNSKATPIILISASVDEYRMEIDLLENIDILSKPFSPREVVDKVNFLLDKKVSTTASAGAMVTFKAGEFVIKEGETGTDIFFVKEGKLSVVRKGANGKNVVISSVGAGEMVGEMGFLLHRTRTASVMAVTDCSLISIPKEKFEVVISAQPKWFKVLFETISTRLEDTTRLLVEERSKH